MGISYSTGNINLVGSVSAGLVSPTIAQTVVNKAIVNASTGATIHTVTAGKTFYCLGATMSSPSNSVLHYNNGANVLSTLLIASGSESHSGGILFTQSAGNDVDVITNSGASDFTGSIWGYEE